MVGIDGGGLDDLFGFTVLGREPAEIDVEVKVLGEMKRQRMKRWLSWSHAWCHEGVLEIRKSIAPRLLDFQKSSELTLVGDKLEDVAEIVEIILQIKERRILAGVSVDPAGIGELVDALGAIDVSQDNGLLIGAPQGFGLMNSIKTAERRLVSGMLKHCGGSLMPWCVGNLKIEPTATAIRATKQTAGDAKIDPAISLFNAIALMSTNPAPKNVKSYLERRGMVTLR